MYNLATLSDKNYLIPGLVLYESLKKYTKDGFILHYLALDNETYQILSQIKDNDLKIYSIKDIEGSEYNTLKENNANVPNRMSPYHYMLCPFFCHYLLTQEKLPHILYADSDICFYDNATDVIKCCTNYDMGFLAHKHCQFGAYVGFFNVGVIFFKSTEVGLKCLTWWKDIGLNPKNQWAEEYGTCGDQKYLELFWSTFSSNHHIKIIDSDIGNSAPWNVSRAEICNGFMTWDSSFVFSEKYKTQKLYFHHFSHFKPIFENDTYKLDWGGEWGNVLGNPGVPELYDDYYKQCKIVKQKYEV